MTREELIRLALRTYEDHDNHTRAMTAVVDALHDELVGPSFRLRQVEPEEPPRMLVLPAEDEKATKWSAFLDYDRVIVCYGDDRHRVIKSRDGTARITAGDLRDHECHTQPVDQSNLNAR